MNTKPKKPRRHRRHSPKPPGRLAKFSPKKSRRWNPSVSLPAEANLNAFIKKDESEEDYDLFKDLQERLEKE